MTPYVVTVFEPAEGEIQDAYLWAMGSNPEFAGRWYNGLLKAFESLDMFPNRCPFAPENDDYPDITVRHLIYRQGQTVYRILYTVIEPNTVRILHVRHGSRGQIR